MKLTRSQLYDLVWSKPITSIAKEYGFSNVGFSKICRRHNIPLPTRGYWAKIRAGIKVSIPPLPNSQNDDDDVYIPPRKSISDDVLINNKVRLFQKKLELKDIGVITLPAHLNSPHKITQNTQKFFEKVINKLEAIQKSSVMPVDYMSMINLVYRGRIRCKNTDCFHVTVSQEMIPRALIYLDVLVKELDKFGFKIQSNVAKETVVVIKDNETFNFWLTEGYKYQEIAEPKGMTKLERILYSGKKPVATGRLTFSIYASITNMTRSWTDGKRCIELELPTIIHEFIRLVSVQKQARIDELAKQEWANKELKKFREIESQRYFEMSIYEEILRESKVFREHQDLINYINYLEIQYAERCGDISMKAASWFAMARKVVIERSSVEKRINTLCSFN